MKVWKDYTKLVADYELVKPTETEIDNHIQAARNMPGIEKVELILLPQFTGMLLDVLLERGFRRVGSLSVNTGTFLRWEKNLIESQPTNEIDKRITMQRAGLNW